MLIKCPECQLQVSDKAIYCPHCGIPMLKSNRTMPPKKRRLALPNGFGQITKITGKNLRKPYRAMVTVGKNEHGRPIQRLLKPVSYFETYNEAYDALVNYNRNPYEIKSNIVLRELYEKWSEQYFKTLTNDSSIRTIKTAWNQLQFLYEMRVSDIRPYMLKRVITESNASENIKSRMKSILNLMFDFAVEYEIVDKNVARCFTLTKDLDLSVGKEHICFTDEEMSILWGNSDYPYVDVVLIQCYSGWRPRELGNIMLDDVDLDNWTFTGGMKTEAGKNRTIPIHSKIRKFVVNRYNESVSIGNNRLFSCLDSATHMGNIDLTYDKYAYRFDKIVKELSLNENHRCHDPRKHFVTMAKKYNVDEYAIKYIVGHSITDITEKIYTERSPEWYAQEIEKIS